MQQPPSIVLAVPIVVASLFVPLQREVSIGAMRRGKFEMRQEFVIFVRDHVIETWQRYVAKNVSGPFKTCGLCVSVVRAERTGYVRTLTYENDFSLGTVVSPHSSQGHSDLCISSADLLPEYLVGSQGQVGRP